MKAAALAVIPGGLSRPLPPAWDGEPVTWGPWESAWTTRDFHIDEERRACTECGDVDRRTVQASGLTRAGRLLAFRCLSCGHDVVVDHDYEVWDLGPEDYGPAGSTLDAADHYTWED